jgi:LPS-assembly lipoprotein
MNRIAIRLSLSLLLLTVLSACGFHLRGQVTQLHSIPQPLYVTGIEPYSPLGKKMQQQLRQAGVSLTGDLDQAGTILRISKVSEGQRTLSLDSRNKEAEVELKESLHFSLSSPQHGELVPDQALRVVRTLYKPQNQVLAGLQEEQALRDDMRRELINLMIRQLAIKF